MESSANTVEEIKVINQNMGKLLFLLQDRADCVYMNMPTYFESGKVYTDGLHVCTAIGVFAKHDSGKKQGILSHFHYSSATEHIDAIEDVIKVYPDILDAETKKAILLYMSTDLKIDFPGKNHGTTEKYADLMENGLTRVLGEDAEILRVPYAFEPSFPRIYPKVFMVDLDRENWVSFVGAGEF